MKAALLLLLPFLPAPAQEPKTIALAYATGETCNAQVLDLKGDEVKLKVFVLGGSMTVTRKIADFTPLSGFTIEVEAKKPASFDQHFAMAKRAIELGLVPQAGKEARAAVEAAPAADTERRRIEVRTWAADTLTSLLQDAVKEGKSKEARHYLKLLSTRLSDMRTEEQLDALEAQVEALESQDHEKQLAAKQAKLDAKVRTEIDKKLGPIQKKIDEGDKTFREAVSKSRSTVASANLCEKAIGSYKTAWKSLQALVEQYPDDAELSRSAESMAERMHDNGIRAALHAANMLMVQSDYKGATDWANRVIAFDPEDAEAKEMLRTIQISAAAASSDWGWGWRVVGGPPPVPPPSAGTTQPPRPAPVITPRD